MTTNELKTYLESVIATYADYKDTLTEIRLSLAGAVMDRERVERFGFRSICTYDECEILEKSIDDPYPQIGNRPILLRLWFSNRMHLREVRMYQQDQQCFRLRIEKPEGGIGQLLEELSECVITPPAERAEDEWKILTDGFSLIHENPNDSEAKRRGRLLDGLIKGAYRHDQAYTVRVILGAVRFPDYCPCTETLASIANEAAKLGMFCEAALLMENILQRDDLEHGTLNLFGCIMHSMERKDCALQCFLHVLEMAPSQNNYSDNVWLEARVIFPEMLREGRFTLLFEMAQCIVKAGFTGTEKDKAEVLCALGMAYEAQNDLGEAELYYRQAIDLLESCKPAIASSNRLLWRNAEARRAAFDKLVQTFPELPEEQDTADAIPMKFTEGDTHGTHWGTVTSDVEEFIACNLPVFVSEGTAKEIVKPIPCSMSSSDSTAAIIIEHVASKYIRAVCLNSYDENAEEKEIFLDSAYPAGIKGQVNKLAVNRFLEWNGNIEGQFECATRNGRTITFFNPFYVYDKQRITKPCVCEFELCGFVERIGLAEKREFEITEGPLLDFERKRVQQEDSNGDEDDIHSVTVQVSSEFSFISSFGEYPDECEFRGIVGSVEWFDYLGTEMCLLSVSFGASGEDEDIIAVDLFAGRHVLGEYSPRPGDSIEGILWLQGFLHSDNIGKPCERKSGCSEWAGYFEIPDSSLYLGVLKATDFQLRALRSVLPNLLHRDLVVSVEPLLDAIPCEPEIVFGLINGDRLYVHVRGCAHDEPEHEAQVQVWKDMCIAYAEQSGLLPCRFVEVCFEVMGKGYGLTYLGLDELKKELNTADDDQECSGGRYQLRWMRSESCD